MPIPLWDVGKSPTHSTKPLVVMVWGDSQGWRWVQEGGVAALYSKFPQITLVNCAVPGSHIGQWYPGQVYWDTCVQQMLGKTPDMIIGFIGTNDTASLYGMPYHALLQQAITDWQASLKCNPKFVVVNIGDNNSGNTYAYWNDVQAEEASLSGYQGVSVISTIGLATEPLPDGIHWTSASMKAIGERIISD